MKKIMLCILLTLLSACGGGGGDSPVAGVTPTPAPTPTPPPASREVALFSGKTYYQQVCATCHTADPTANFNGIRSTGANNPSAIAAAFVRAVQMNFLVGRYSTAELSAIASYLAEPTAPPGGLYVGYYQEDPAGNPEDPTQGALYLALPEGEGKYSGKMEFTYVGCQSNSLGNLTGNKININTSIVGTWSGNIDNTSQTGTYTGSFDTANNFYSGIYTVDGGKQAINLPCIQYIIAPYGNWNIFPVEQNTPPTFTSSVNANTLIWSTPTGYAGALVSVMDVAAATTINGSNAVKVQSNVIAPLANFDLTPFALTSGKQYLAVVNAFDSSRARLGAGSKLFTAP